MPKKYLADGKTLTELSVRALQPKSALYRKRDRNGLCVEVHIDGKKFWRYRYRFQGKATMASYGQYPEVSLARARSAHAADISVLRQGQNPNAVRRRNRHKELSSSEKTFRFIADNWLKVKSADWTNKNLIKERGRLVNHAFPIIGNLLI